MNGTSFTRSVAVAGIVLCGIAAAQPAIAATAPENSAGHGDPSALTDPSAVNPHEAAYGTFAQMYRQNTSDFMTPETNPAIGVLSSMLDYFTPGETWNDGTILNPGLHEQNIAAIEQLTQNRTDDQAREAYIYDRRNQNYSMSEGLEEDTDAFREFVNAGTTIPDEIPAEALTEPFDDEGNENGEWADEDSTLGSVVELVNTVRGEWATSNRAKEFYQYMRPFRWSDDVVIVPELEPVKKPDEKAEADGGFPSGHTNAAFLAGFALANAIPEHADDLMAQAAAVGHSRAVAGMHSALDVIGGRILATAVASSTLADGENAELIERASVDAAAGLRAELDLDTDRDAYQARLAQYLADTTFGLDPVGEAGAEARVPATAESLIANRYPYLDDEQLRWVLYSTALESGLPLVDDAEGWGRINLFAANNGYGSFDRDVVVSLDEAAAGYGAADVWRNDIDGAGGLTVAGSGSLTLAGENTFAGGVRLEGGSLSATTGGALGFGDVALVGGTFVDGSADPIVVGGDFEQAADAALELSISDAAQAALSIEGSATLAGSVIVDLSALAEVPTELPLVVAEGVNVDDVALGVLGAPEGYEPSLLVEDGTLLLVDAAATPEPTEPTEAPEPEPTAEPTAAPTTEPTAAPTAEPTAAPTAEPTAAPTAEPTAAPTAQPDNDGDLAPTGESVATPLAIGAALTALLGMAALVAMRRRRA